MLTCESSCVRICFPACRHFKPHRMSCCHVFCHIIVLCCLVFLLLFDHVSCVSSLLHCRPLTSQTLRPLWTVDALRIVLTVHLLAAAIDSWLLPFYHFLFSNHPLPPSSQQEVRLQIRLQDRKNYISCYIFFLSHLSC